jgi:hypothetical protein
VKKASFKYWHEEIADIPSLNQTGEWVDLETGFTYEDYCNSFVATKTRALPSKYESQIKAARSSAKANGFVALRGSTLQKQWAVQIREARLKEIQEEAIRKCAGSNLFSSSKFWIDTRNQSNEEIVLLVRNVNSAHDKVITASREYESLIPTDVKPGGRFELTPRFLELSRIIYGGKDEIAKLIVNAMGITNMAGEKSTWKKARRF